MIWLFCVLFLMVILAVGSFYLDLMLCVAFGCFLDGVCVDFEVDFGGVVCFTIG